LLVFSEPVTNVQPVVHPTQTVLATVRSKKKNITVSTENWWGIEDSISQLMPKLSNVHFTHMKSDIAVFVFLNFRQHHPPTLNCWLSILIPVYNSITLFHLQLAVIDYMTH